MAPPVATVDRPLTLRLRPDLQAAPVAMSGNDTWVVKDPMTLEHFQFTAAEYALLDWLRRPVSIAELQRRFAQKFAPQTITPEAVWEFLTRLHETGLLVGDGAHQGAELLARRRRDQLRLWTMAWTRLLAIRFRGIDPDAMLNRLNRRIGWLFSKALLLPVGAIVLYALWLALGHFGEFRERLPQLSALVDMRNLPWLLLAIGGVKVLHELGHALTCKYLGGEVRELGVMLLAFVPCLYCDVSDAWRFPSKWQRIAVSSAGIAIEVFLAAVATIVWWHAQPGIIQLIAMNVMIVCTVNTLLVNGNPLMRYDGYYILSDLAEAPNLWQRSREVLRRLMNDWLFSSRGALAPDQSDDPLIPPHQRPWLASYAIASKIYMALILVTIVWGLVEFLYPYHLQTLAYAVGFAVLGSVLISPIQKAMRLARDPIRREQFPRGRIAVVVAVGLAMVVGILSLPANYYVKAPFVLLPEDAARVYATLAGTLDHVTPAGTKVARGEIVAQLQDTSVELETARYEAEHRLRRLRVEHLERLRGLDRSANDELPTARAALADSERRLAERRNEARRLTLTAPLDGVVIAAPHLPGRMTPHAQHPTMRLTSWNGSLLDPVNSAAFVEPGTLVCLVGDPARLTAVLLVDDIDVKRLQPGQRARLWIAQLPGQVLEGEVVDVARHDVRDSATEAAGQADLASLFAGLAPPGRIGSLYQARVRLDSSVDQSLVIGGRGKAKVAAERITLGRRILRFFAQTFRLPM